MANVTADKVIEAGSTAKDFTVRKGKEVGSVAAEKAGQVRSFSFPPSSYNAD